MTDNLQLAAQLERQGRHSEAETVTGRSWQASRTTPSRGSISPVSCGAAGGSRTRGPSNLSTLDSHMYRSSQAREVVRLLAQNRLVMEQEDLEVTALGGLPAIQQKMLDGRMGKPKGVALVQADRAGQPIASFENAYLGEPVLQADPDTHRYLSVHVAEQIAILTLCREQALNALNHDLISQLAEVIAGLKRTRRIQGHPVRALIIRGSGRAFVAGADVTEFYGSPAKRIEAIALLNIRLFDAIENLKIPVIALQDGFVPGRRQ